LNENVWLLYILTLHPEVDSPQMRLTMSQKADDAAAYAFAYKYSFDEFS